MQREGSYAYFFNIPPSAYLGIDVAKLKLDVVSLLNLAILFSYRKTKNIRRKTDRVDAYLLALYGQEEQPVAMLPISYEVMRKLLHIVLIFFPSAQ
jgi:hypothetical protein